MAPQQQAQTATLFHLLESAISLENFHATPQYLFY